MLLILVVIVIVINIPYDLIPTYHSKQWGAFWAYSVIMVFALTLTICISLDVRLPSPAVTLKKAITAIFGIE